MWGGGIFQGFFKINFTAYEGKIKINEGRGDEGQGGMRG